MPPVLPFAVAMLAMASPGNPPHASCRTSDAVYASMADTRASLRFRPVTGQFISDLSLELRTASGKRYWFVFDGGSAPSIFAISTSTDPAAADVALSDGTPGGPLGEVPFYAFDHGMRFVDIAPRSSGPAPYYLFIPDLSDKLWHLRDPLPLGMFRLAGCAARSP
jgi:hypothetical protein